MVVGDYYLGAMELHAELSLVGARTANAQIVDIEVVPRSPVDRGTVAALTLPGHDEADARYRWWASSLAVPYGGGPDRCSLPDFEPRNVAWLASPWRRR